MGKYYVFHANETEYDSKKNAIDEAAKYHDFDFRNRKICLRDNGDGTFTQVWPPLDKWDNEKYIKKPYFTQPVGDNDPTP